MLCVCFVARLDHHILSHDAVMETLAVTAADSEHFVFCCWWMTLIDILPIIVLVLSVLVVLNTLLCCDSVMTLLQLLLVNGMFCDIRYQLSCADFGVFIYFSVSVVVSRLCTTMLQWSRLICSSFSGKQYGHFLAGQWKFRTTDYFCSCNLLYFVCI